MLPDIIDLGKVSAAGVVGVGSWYTGLSQLLQISISMATLVYIIGKCYYMIKNKN